MLPQFQCLFGVRVSYRGPDTATAGPHSSVAQRWRKLPAGVVSAGRSARLSVMNTCGDLKERGILLCQSMHDRELKPLKCVPKYLSLFVFS